MIISDMTAPLCGYSQTHLGTSMSSGGGYIIRAERMDTPPIKARNRQTALTGGIRVIRIGLLNIIQRMHLRQMLALHHVQVCRIITGTEMRNRWLAGAPATFWISGRLTPGRTA